MKLTTIFIVKTKQIYAKILTVPESTFKIKAMLPWIAFEILLTSAVICEPRFLHGNEIFRATNTKAFIKAILESSYKLLQMPQRTTALQQQQSINFSRGFQF